jgi:hypothetical protein
LKGAGTCGNQHLTATEQSWDEIGPGFACACSRFGDQSTARRNGEFYRFGQLNLGGAKPVTGRVTRKWALLRKYFFNRRILHSETYQVPDHNASGRIQSRDVAKSSASLQPFKSNQ